MNKREFLKGVILFFPAGGVLGALAANATEGAGKDAEAKAQANLEKTKTTTESALFEWCVRAGTPEFKAISNLVKESPPE